MKKNRYFLALSLMLVMAGQLVAQVNLEEPEDRIPVKFKTENHTTNAFGKKAVESGWLSPTQLMTDYGATFQNSYFPLFQDSSVVFVPGTSATSQVPYHNAWNLFGTVFQPSDPLYELQTTGWKFSRFTTYTCDSVAFPYSYVRNIEQIDVNGTMVDVVDTIILQFFRAANLTYWNFGTTSTEVFSIPNVDKYSAKILGSTDVVFRDTILLTPDLVTDESLGETISISTLATAIGANVNSIPANGSLNGANIIGFSISYRTMVPYSFGDTLYSYNDQAVPAKKMNIFGTGAMYNNGSRVIQEDQYNNSFVTNRQVRYGQKVGNFKGYLPTLSSTGWQSDFYFNGLFHVTGANVGVSDVANKLGMKVYPNPAFQGEDLVIESASKSTKATLKVIDIVGNEVFNASDLDAASSYRVSTDNMLPGIYFVSLTADGVTATQKVIITE